MNRENTSGQVLQLDRQEKEVSANAGLQASSLQADALLWSLRALQLAQDMYMELGLDESRPHMGMNNRELLEAFRDQMRPLCGGEAPASLNAVVEQLSKVESRLATIELPPCASDRTISAISLNCNLGPAEQMLLRFKVATGTSELLSMVLQRFFSHFTTRGFLDLISTALQMETGLLRDALNPDGFLSRSRIMRLKQRNEHHRHGIEGALFIQPGILLLLEMADGDYGRLVRTMASPSPENGLSAHNFSYMEDSWSLALGYLQGSLKGGYKGANILLHGLPGVGKTEFARALTRAANSAGHEIKSAHLDHSLLCPDERRDSYFLAGELLPHNRKTVLIFDDADGSLGNVTHSPTEMSWSKAALNQMLENNPFPTIWLMNETHMLDTAFLRRFDVSIPFRRPPASVIQRLLKKALPRQSVSENWLRQVSSAQDVTPAIVKRLERIAGRMNCADKLEKVLNTSLELSRIRVSVSQSGAFDRQYCNATPGIEAICSYLEQSSSSRLMLHGPTGTGKTALARHLAESTDLQPQLVRPSEILGSFVGQTERNIARLFGETDPSEQLIILDEFESLAADRRGSRHSWEVSQVAEFLSRFDDYKGRVIACTNLPDNVDIAIRRRFHMKARLDALTRQQRVDVIRKFALELKCKLPKNIHEQTGDLDALAFGHVMNAAEVARYMNRVDWLELIKLIRSELAGTNGEISRRIGFIHRGGSDE